MGRPSFPLDRLRRDQTRQGDEIAALQQAAQSRSTGPSGPVTAAGVSYDHTASGLSATDVQAAVDEVAASVAAPTGTGFRHVLAGVEDAAAVTIDGQSAASGGDVKVVAPAIHAAGSVTTLIGTDEFGLWDAATTLLGKITWTNLKANIKSYADTLYRAIGAITEADFSFTDITTANASTSKHGLLKKLPGDSTKYQDGNGNWTSPSATGGAGWQTAVDLDFSAQASQTLTADGAYTIGGLTWTKASSTNDNVAMAVTNGTGLVIQPKSTGQYFGLTRTAPYLYLDLVSAIPAYYLEMPLRVWVYVSADNIAASGDVVGFAIENMSASATTACVYIMRRANNGGTKSIEFTGAIGATVATITAVAANLDNTDRVMCFSQPTGRVSGSAVLWYGADASGWPSVAALRPSQRNAAVTSTFTPSQDMVTGLPMKLVLFAQRNGSATALSVTIKRVRIDFQTT